MSYSKVKQANPVTPASCKIHFSALSVPLAIAYISVYFLATDNLLFAFSCARTRLT